jgi:hypothetical protein
VAKSIVGNLTPAPQNWRKCMSFVSSHSFACCYGGWAGRHLDIQFRDQISLMKSLLLHIDIHVDLPKEAVSGLADLSVRMQGVCERVFR